MIRHLTKVLYLVDGITSETFDASVSFGYNEDLKEDRSVASDLRLDIETAIVEADINVWFLHDQVVILSPYNCGEMPKTMIDATVDVIVSSRTADSIDRFDALELS